jgi:ribose transport system ATP-binding protein
VRALIDAQFELFSGEVHALMGENGAGKSTLMKVLAGVYQKDTGDIEIDGKAVDIPDPHAAQALGIGIIHQELNLMNHLTVAQNIFIGREPMGRFGVIIDTPKMARDTQTILDRLHLNLDPSTLVSELTVAKQQMVEIAKALSFQGTRVLIMDEPTAALGPAETAQVRNLVRQLKDEGIGIFLISHDIHDVFDLSDRISVMYHGRIVDTVNKNDVTADDVLGMIILGKKPGEVTEEEKESIELRG